MSARWGRCGSSSESSHADGEQGRVGSLPWFSRPELESRAAVTSGGAGEVVSSLRGLALAQEMLAEVT